jgi:tRNA dimethylallyltransferase
MEIINFDSIQVYRGMDIGTAKPDAGDLNKVPHHLLDIRDPDEPCSVGQYIPLFRKAVKDITARKNLPVAVGGTGLYLRGALGGIFDGPERDDDLREEMRGLEERDPGALYRQLEEKDPETAKKTMRNDHVRIIRALEVYELTGGVPISELQREHSFKDRPFDASIYCLIPPREELYMWVEERVDRMIEKGLLEEVKWLKGKGYSRKLASMKALGYRELMAHLDGEMNLEETVKLIKRNTRRYAKRQLTWFKGEEGVRWLEYSHRDQLTILAEQIAMEFRGGRFNV